MLGFCVALTKEENTMLNNESRNKVRECLDLLGMALAHHNHQWTDEERRAYEGAIQLLTSDDCTETGSSASG